MIKIIKLATIALCFSAMINQSNAQENKTFECEGKKVTVEGKKTANYTGEDNLTRNVTAIVREDSIIYCVIRTNADGSMNKMIKYHMFIGDIVFNVWSKERAFATWTEGSRTMNKVTFYAVDGKQLNWYEEMICDLKQYGLYKKEVLEMSFDAEVDAKEFYTNIEVLHSALPDGKSAGAQGASTPITFYNDTNAEGFLSVSSKTPNYYPVHPKQSKMFYCKGGESVIWSLTNDSKANKTARYKVNEQTIKDKTVNISTGTKK